MGMFFGLKDAGTSQELANGGMLWFPESDGT
jgi:hypothetical protein